jgi:hypothetical protein
MIIRTEVSVSKYQSYAGYVQNDQKVTQSTRDTHPICQKINYTEITKQKNSVIACLGNVHGFQLCIHSFPHV